MDFDKKEKITRGVEVYTVHCVDLDKYLGYNWWKIVDLIPGSKIVNGYFEVMEGKVEVILDSYTSGEICFKAGLFNTHGNLQ